MRHATQHLHFRIDPRSRQSESGPKIRFSEPNFPRLPGRSAGMTRHGACRFAQFDAFRQSPARRARVHSRFPFERRYHPIPTVLSRLNVSKVRRSSKSGQPMSEPNSARSGQTYFDVSRRRYENRLRNCIGFIGRCAFDVSLRRGLDEFVFGPIDQFGNIDTAQNVIYPTQASPLLYLMLKAAK